MKEISFSDEAINILQNEDILALPTETVYGLGIRWDSQVAYDRLCLSKNRRPDKPIAVMCSKNFNLNEYLYINKNIQNVINSFLPGPLTIIVKAKDNAPYQTHLGTYKVGIRIPLKKDLLDFLNILPFPLQVTSANLSGEKALYKYEDVKEVFKNNIYIKGIVKGNCDSTIPTTVVDLTTDQPILIRQGEIKIEDIIKVFNGEK